eukprot:g6872.t1
MFAAASAEAHALVQEPAELRRKRELRELVTGESPQVRRFLQIAEAKGTTPSELLHDDDQEAKHSRRHSSYHLAGGLADGDNVQRGLSTVSVHAPAAAPASPTALSNTTLLKQALRGAQAQAQQLAQAGKAGATVVASTRSDYHHRVARRMSMNAGHASASSTASGGAAGPGPAAARGRRRAKQKRGSIMTTLRERYLPADVNLGSSSSDSGSDSGASDSGGAGGAEGHGGSGGADIDAQVEAEMRKWERQQRRERRREQKREEKQRLRQLYSAQALLRREAVRFDPRVTAQLHTLFSVADVDGSGGISLSEWRVVFAHLYSVLHERPVTVEETSALAEEEFMRDTQGRDFMEKHAFLDAFFQLADTWTDEIEPTAYAEFLKKIVGCFGLDAEQIAAMRRQQQEKDRGAQRQAEAEDREAQQDGACEQGGADSDGAPSEDAPAAAEQDASAEGASSAMLPALAAAFGSMSFGRELPARLRRGQKRQAHEQRYRAECARRAAEAEAMRLQEQMPPLPPLPAAAHSPERALFPSPLRPPLRPPWRSPPGHPHASPERAG